MIDISHLSERELRENLAIAIDALNSIINLDTSRLKTKDSTYELKNMAFLYLKRIKTGEKPAFRNIKKYRGFKTVETVNGFRIRVKEG